MHKHQKPVVGVSRCLLGDRVRYDAASKADHIVINELSQLFELVPVCPEVEAGLGVPRPPVQLSGDIEQPRITGRDDPALDVTQTLLNTCDRLLQDLQQLDGYICKSRSPSCGLATTPVFIDGECVSDTSDGVWIRALQARYPALPIIDEIGLADDSRYEAFIDKLLGNSNTGP